MKTGKAMKDLTEKLGTKKFFCPQFFCQLSGSMAGVPG
jgi:hypothetical protein